MLTLRVVLTGVGIAVALGAGAAPAVAQADCTEGERSWTMDTLRDWVSFSEQLSVIRVVGESIPPAPEGPEGWAGLIGRRVTVKVERTFWRRPGAPRAPERFRLSDWGWSGDLDHKVPIRVCGGARLEVGRRYLAPIASYHGAWFPTDDARLRLRRDLVVGGVDGGEPTFAHQELAGRRVGQAARLVARTVPYRAALEHPKLNPVRRWNAADEDRYRVAGGRRFEPITVAAGVTAKTRWTLYTRRGRRGGWCLGLAMRPLWPGPGSSPSGEGCGGRFSARHELTLGLTAARGRGAFVYGHAWRTVARVEVDSGGGPPVQVPTAPSPKEIGGYNRYWVTPIADEYAGAIVRGFDVQGNLLEQVELLIPYAAPG